MATHEMSDNRWPSQDYLSGLFEALRLITVSLRLVRMWLIVITALLGLMLWRMW